MRRKLTNGILAAALTLAGSAPLMLAQYGQPAGDAAGDRQHGVARLAIVQGNVNIGRANSGGLAAAVINAPLMAGDRLQTSPNSRAEVEFDAANVARIAPNTDLGFADLADQRYRLQIGVGTMQYRVLRNQDAQVEIDTPSVAVTPLGAGAYRIAVLADGSTRITVRSGALELNGPCGSEQIGAGRSVLVRGDPAAPEMLDIAEIPQDRFDDWCASLDRRLLSARGDEYVSPDIEGAADLDAYGNWVPSQYGTVWEPQPPYAGWSPYSDGQWVSEPYYGWTWVDAAPWGWAPYHYGRWFWNGGHGWCWWPGLRHARAYWSPALVGFFGWGGSGGIGWVALAPFEVLHPWWGRNRSYGSYGRGWSRFGAMRDVNVARIYRNAAIRGGALVAARDRFGHPGGGHFHPAAMTQLRRTSLFRGALPMAPAHANMEFSRRRAVANPRLAAAAGRHFYSRQRTRPQAPSSYRARQRQRPNGGWQRFGDPGAGNSLRQTFLRNRPKNGWHRFGAPEHRHSGGYRGAQRNAHPAAPRRQSPSFHSQPSRGGGFHAHGRSAGRRTSGPLTNERRNTLPCC